MPAKPDCSSAHASGKRAGAILAARSPLFLWFFSKLFERDLAASFHAVRCSGLVPTGPGPLVIFANHPSWWDGQLVVWLSSTMFADRLGFAPVDAAMLERYRFFGKLGAFGVTQGYGGASAFLAVGEAVLARDHGLLLVHAEGRFRDVRDRPLRPAPGLAHLGRRVPHARFVPLAIEYAFWDERRPNLLLRFGEVVPAEVVIDRKSVALGESLTATMDALSEDARSRNPAHFTTLLAGKTKINAFYDAWRRGKALLHGHRFDPAHGAGMDVR